MSKDRMRSKMNFEPTQREVAISRQQQQEIGQRIDDLGDLHYLLKTDAQRGPYTKMVLSRIGQLLTESLDKPLTDKVEDLIWHGEVRGRLIEQIRNVNLLQGIEAKREELESQKKTLTGRIQGLLKSMSKGNE